MIKGILIEDNDIPLPTLVIRVAVSAGLNLIRIQATVVSTFVFDVFIYIRMIVTSQTSERLIMFFKGFMTTFTGLLECRMSGNQLPGH